MKIGAVGDIALTHDYDVVYHAKGPGYPFELVRDILKEHDILIGNLEAPFCLGGEVYPERLSLRAHPGYVNGLKDAGFTALIVGNNHILDYREKAFFETLDLVDSHGFQRCGAGRDLAEAFRPIITEKNGISVGMVSRCDVTIKSPFYASENFRGLAPLDVMQLEDDIRSLRSKVDVVLVVLHWGMEDWQYPAPDQVKTAHRIIDSGADLVIGHHPHVLQGIEKYRNGYIAYSLGNFLFSDLDWRWANDEGEIKRATLKMSRTRKQTGILSIDVTKEGIGSVRMIPCRIGNDLRVAPIRNAFLSDMGMRALSWPITMKSYPAFWYNYSIVNARWHSLKGLAVRVSSMRRIIAYIERKSSKIWRDVQSHMKPGN